MSCSKKKVKPYDLNWKSSHIPLLTKSLTTNNDHDQIFTMAQRLTYRRRLPCTFLILFKLMSRQHPFKSYSSHQDTRWKIKILAHQETRQRSTMWWLWHHSPRGMALIHHFPSFLLLLFFCLYRVLLGVSPTWRWLCRFQPSVPANMPVLPRMKRQYNVPTAALAVQIVWRIGLCERSSLRNKSWWNNWLSKRPPRNRTAIISEGERLLL